MHLRNSFEYQMVRLFENFMTLKILDANLEKILVR